MLVEDAENVASGTDLLILSGIAGIDPIMRETINKKEDSNMDKDRIEGVAKQAKGTIKEAVGKTIGDAKLAADGKSDKVEGKIQNAFGGAKDALKK